MDNQKIEDYYGRTVFGEPDQEHTPSLLYYNAYIGVEVELEGLHELGVAPMGWSLHADGSLRNGGQEFVFNGAFEGEEIIQAFTFFEQFFDKRGLKPATSARTSTHIHIDVSKMTARQLLNMFTLYAVIEPSLFRSYAPKREGNHFCVAMYECDFVRSRIQKLNEGIAEFCASINSDRSTRYSAVNLNSIPTIRTVEFRNFYAATTSQELLEYANIVLALKKFGMTYEGKPALMFETASDQGLSEIFYTHFPPHIAKRLAGGDKAKVDSLILKGIRTAQTLLSNGAAPPSFASVSGVQDEEGQSDSPSKSKKSVGGEVAGEHWWAQLPRLHNADAEPTTPPAVPTTGVPAGRPARQHDPQPALNMPNDELLDFIRGVHPTLEEVRDHRARIVWGPSRTARIDDYIPVEQPTTPPPDEF